jgi:plastocyanin
MKKLVAAAVVGLLLPLSSLSAATKDVEVVDRAFQPKITQASVGDVVHWSTEGGTGEGHNVREAHKLFYSGRDTDFIDFKATFSAGTFEYWCEIHRQSGMKGTVKVPAKLSAGPAGKAFTVQWASGATNTGSKYDVQYRIGGGAWRTWVTGTAATKKVFGANSAPIDVEPGTKYGIRVRSRKAADKSDWSPAAAFTA